MFINAVGCYVPSSRVHNDYFKELNGLTDEWIFQRTGIRTRSRVTSNEDGNTMGLAAVAKAAEQLPYSLEEVDLIITAGYSPLDTVGTLGHVAQRDFKMINAAVVLVSSACSSFVNACEIVDAYFLSNKASKALVICSEHNSYYSNETDEKAGHLWGDAAVAAFFSKEKTNDSEPQVVGISTKGLGHIGKGPEGVCLKPRTVGIQMPDGRDVFINATHYMIDALSEVAKIHGISINDIDYICAHQANMRIIKNIERQADIPGSKFLANIEELGNTGSASAMLVAIQNWESFKKDDLVALTVFGGGYSSGGMLIRF